MTPDQQRALLATYGPDWMTADLLQSDDGITRAKESMRSGGVRAGSDAFTERHHFDTTARGIVTYRLVSDGRDERGFAINLRRVDEVLAVPWAAVKTHRAALSTAALDRLRAARQAFRDHRPYPTPYPDLGVRKVGPSSDIHPDDRELYHQRMQEYQRDVVAPWRAESRALNDALAEAIRACLPGAADTGPVDLLDHLAAMETAS